MFHILVVNPGSTSTKVAYYEDNRCVFDTDVFHDSSILKTFPTINDQLEYRLEVVYDFLNKQNITPTFDAIVARGGSCVPLRSGIYEVNEKMIEDTKNNCGHLYHSSMLGVQMGKALQDKYSGILLTINPTVVDELQDVARITGLKGVYRRAISHALNIHAIAKEYSSERNKKVEDLKMIVGHIDGGITIGAMEHGKLIDCNDGGGGEGPFTPTRMGSLAMTDAIDILKEKSEDELHLLTSTTGGLSSHFGTSNSDAIHQLVEEKDPYACLIWQAMIYQINKQIGAMATVLHGEVDAIVLSGGLLRFEDIVEGIKHSCTFIAPIVIYPKEREMKTMAEAGLAVLEGKEKANIYTGEPVFTGFDF